MKYIAKDNTWFDKNTEVILIDDYTEAFGVKVGLFCGKHNGNDDEEVCSFDEFEQAK